MSLSLSDLLDAGTPIVRRSYRVGFANSLGLTLAGIVDRPAIRTAAPSQSLTDVEDAPVVVFSHCFTCGKDLKAITRISRRLAERGVAVLRFDMTGLGGSEGDFSQTHFSTNLDDLSAAIRFASQEIGPACGLIGHSFGGAASLAIAAGVAGSIAQPLPEPLRQAIGCVVSIAAPSDTQHLAELLSRMNPQIESVGRGEVVIGGKTWTITREALADLRSHRLADRLSDIRCAVLAFHSPVDRTLGYDHALRIASLVRDEAGLPACSLVTLGGADHLLVDDPRDAEFVADTAAAFIHRHRM